MREKAIEAIRKKEIKLSLFSGNIIIENPKKINVESIKIIKEFNRVVSYKINTNSITFILHI